MATPYVTNELTGSIFTNDRKNKDTQPDKNGTCKIGGVEYWIAGWVKQPKNLKGKAYLSLSFTPKEDIVEPTPQPASSQAKPF